ncbi:MAG: SLBB domain-containing protein [Candidatus Edwardsbacteria bacterium]
MEFGRTFERITLLILILAFSCTNLLAQERISEPGSGRETATGGTPQYWGEPRIVVSPQYRLVPGAESTLQMGVSVWGEVKNPGLYLVPDNTNIISLISYAGGPTEDADLGRVFLVKRNPASQPQRSGSYRKIIKVNVKRFLKTGDASLLPPLEPDDTVIVKSNLFHSFSRLTTLVSQVALITSAYLLITGKR